MPVEGIKIKIWLKTNYAKRVGQNNTEVKYEWGINIFYYSQWHTEILLRICCCSYFFLVSIKLKCLAASSQWDDFINWNLCSWARMAGNARFAFVVVIGHND